MAGFVKIYAFSRWEDFKKDYLINLLGSLFDIHSFFGIKILKPLSDVYISSFSAFPKDYQSEKFFISIKTS